MKSSKLASLQVPCTGCPVRAPQKRVPGHGCGCCVSQTGTSQGTTLAKRRIEAEESRNKRCRVDSLELPFDFCCKQNKETRLLCTFAVCLAVAVHVVGAGGQTLAERADVLCFPASRLFHTSVFSPACFVTVDFASSSFIPAFLICFS